ncbi:DegT/DnrJ/EryC1/StrS family aminotransferase [Prochlorococcus marinus XMU1419]|uniref:DegT/DnrJ/EryC1/StrS family aminotransferase n=1 Tax=Prochlorococcus marinus TaxID=1219 RepID=UPI001ADC3966|nr:DegT/DnrJ/EryC1/StrS family aminotransferase [Prochlorococcus marinus]MBO8234244.1 DegT/DnrJ/EryC1/StrS family aminotransferase [Prochlorococcus marinus XMU1419]MBW3075934.1 aminotransferase DegT [Prochlorococcus marinus str. XMU1419]
MKIPIARTELIEEDLKSVLNPLKSGWLVQGPMVKEFEDKWSDFVGCKHSIAVTSCTSALFLSLAALDFGPEDEAIVPAFTWISTANVVEHLGGKVKFAEIDLNTFNIDLESIEKLITKKTKAIIPVHLFGLAANIEKIVEIAKKNNLLVIEDAACGFGAYYKNKHVGTFGDTGCFSFHPRKSITTGEGGMITTDNDDLVKKIRKLRDHGASMTDLQRHLGPRPYLLADHPYAGYNFRMTDIQAALGSSQMNRAKEIVSERQKIAMNYINALKETKWLKVPNIPRDFSHGFQSFACLFMPEEIDNALKFRDFSKIEEIKLKRNKFMEYLLDKGISTRPATHAVHMLSFYKNKYNIHPQDFPISLVANDCSISIPLFHGLKDDEQTYIIENISRGN